MNIFRQAVVRLTLWYVGVILLLSLAFSLALYNVSTRELNELQRRQEQQLRASQLYLLPPEFSAFNSERIRQIEESKRNIAAQIAYFNVIILGLSGAGAFLLAKRTLQPIEESVELQNRFTADASHELRTPLTAMRTELEVALRDSNLTLKQSKKLQQSMLQEVGNLERLISGLLRLAKHDAGTAEYQKISLAEVIHEAVARVRAVAEARKISISTELRAVTVAGDRWGLIEVISILLDNAVKYSHEGGEVQVTVRAERTEAVVTVRDQGIGIAASDLPYVFNRFYRADTSRSKQQTEGYGLGLSIAQKIVERHRGDISVKSTVGKGSVFTVHLPR